VPTAPEPTTIYERGWIVRVRPPTETPSGRAALLLHGWTGDETVMWIFARALPPNVWIFAPRGPISASPGYGWSAVRHQKLLAAYQDFTTPAAQLVEQVDHWLWLYGLTRGALDVMGFSQGAALAYTLLADYPTRIARLAALAGYLPSGAADQFDRASLADKPVLIAHGSHDETVPIQSARDAADALSHTGVKLTYCEDPVGHKLGAGCMKKLTQFFSTT